MFEVAEFCFHIDLQELFKLYSKERQKAHSNSFNFTGSMARFYSSWEPLRNKKYGWKKRLMEYL